MERSPGTFVVRRIIAVLAIVVIVNTGFALRDAHASSAGNYGGVSAATKQKMISIIYSRFGSSWLGREMVRCAVRESGLNPKAYNWAGPVFGLFQIKAIHRHSKNGVYVESVQHFAQRMYDPYENTDSAKALYARDGLAPWGGGC